MGGNAFTEARRVYMSDIKMISEVLKGLRYDFGDAIDWTFCGSNIGMLMEMADKGSTERDSGDIDLLIFAENPGLVEDIKSAFHKIALKHRKIGKSDHFAIDGFQLDINWTGDRDLIDWAGEASFSTIDDPYPTLYRNEVLFAAAKYFPKPGEILKFVDGVPVEYSRNAFTVYEGFVRNYYSVQNKRNPLLVNKNPRKESSAQIHCDFNRFLTTGYFRKVGRDFKSIFDATLLMYEEQSTYIVYDICKGLIRKGKPIPKEITDAFDLEGLGFDIDKL